jgi:hypothetical protein
MHIHTHTYAHLHMHMLRTTSTTTHALAHAQDVHSHAQVQSHTRMHIHMCHHTHTYLTHNHTQHLCNNNPRAPAHTIHAFTRIITIILRHMHNQRTHISAYSTTTDDHRGTLNATPRTPDHNQTPPPMHTLWHQHQNHQHQHHQQHR